MIYIGVYYTIVIHNVIVGQEIQSVSEIWDREGKLDFILARYFLSFIHIHMNMFLSYPSIYFLDVFL